MMARCKEFGAYHNRTQVTCSPECREKYRTPSPLDIARRAIMYETDDLDALICALVPHVAKHREPGVPDECWLWPVVDKATGYSRIYRSVAVAMP